MSRGRKHHRELSEPGLALLNRRDFMGWAGGGLGAIALTALLAREGF